ncbi:MAG: MaoC family dehydratase N-terminal domain-containing protein [Clostridia bacterium]|nr:MaoC family dehydratase N-terminal domain-containing protein [Clostridia bacterium]
MIDRSNIGKSFPPYAVEVENHQLRLFAKAIGETNEVYTDEKAAAAQGYSALPAPPTFGFSLSLSKPNVFEAYEALGIDLSRLLHGEQKFDYIAPIHVGDVITLHEKITDIFEKPEKRLEFIVIQTSLVNQHNEHVGEMTNTLVIKN